MTRILIVLRDNIGDLICTLPLIAPALTLMFIVGGFLRRMILDTNLHDHMKQFMLVMSIYYVMAHNNQSQSEERK